MAYTAAPEMSYGTLGLRASSYRAGPSHQSSSSMCTVYKNKDYKSASDALEAYISDQCSDGDIWKIRSKYEKDVDDLLMQRDSGSQSGKSGAGQDGLRDYLNVRRLVDASYEKLREHETTRPSVLEALSATDRLLTTLTIDNLSPFASDTNLTRQPMDSQPSLSSTTINTLDQHLSARLPSKQNYPSVLSHSRNTSNKTEVSKIPKHLRRSWLDDSSLGATTYDDKISQSGYHSDSSVDAMTKDTALSLAGLDSGLTNQKYGSKSAPQSPHQGYAWIERGSGAAFDDTVTELNSGGKTKSHPVPYWVKELESKSALYSTVVDGTTSRYPDNNFDPNTLSVSSPRKQLRFDLDRSQSSVKSTQQWSGHDRSALNNTDERLHDLSNSSPRTGGILKGANVRKQLSGTSLTTEDISSSMFQSRSRLDRKYHDRHVRSFSANGRLSSTPIKPSQSAEYTERPHISGLSSVHSATNTGSTASNQAKCYFKSQNQSDRPSQYLFSAVQDAETKGHHLGVYSGLTGLKSRAQFNPKLAADDTTNVHSGGDGMRSEHRVYLKNLVREIDDKSSIATGYTELQDIVNTDPGIGRDLVTPVNRPTNPVGLENTPDTDMVLDGDRPWEMARRPLQSPDFASVESVVSSQPGFHHKRGGIVEKFLKECRVLHTETDHVLENSSISSPPREPPIDIDGSTSKPGTMEALKNMLFTMQSMTTADSLLAEAESVENAKKSEQTTDPGNLTVESERKPEDIMSPGTKNLLESASNHGGDSLERALVHLGRLKNMVKGNKDELPK